MKENVRYGTPRCYTGAPRKDVLFILGLEFGVYDVVAFLAFAATGRLLLGRFLSAWLAVSALACACVSSGTGLAAGLLVCLFIHFLGPGMAGFGQFLNSAFYFGHVFLFPGFLETLQRGINLAFFVRSDLVA